MKRLLLCICACISILCGWARPARNLVDYLVTLDSINWFRERYCDMLACKDNRAPQTLKNLQRHFIKLPKNSQDSVLASHYDAMVTLFEQERRSRGYAFADCYYVLADPDDPKLGALYLNDIVMAIEECDTVKLRSRMDSLNAFANRNNLDYDQDLSEARANMLNLRRKIKFDNTDLMSLIGFDGSFWILSPDDDGKNAEETVVAIMNGAPMFLSLNSGGVYGYSGIKFKKSNNYFIADCSDSSGMEVYTNERNDANKSMFKAWGNDRGGSSKPELLAQGRQIVQNTHAQVSGELARKKYSFGQRLGGEATVTLIDAGLNALLDLWSIKKQVSYRFEMSLTMISPAEIIGTVASVRVTTRSDRPNEPQVETSESPVRYIKTYPEKGLYLINEKCEPWISPSIPLSRYEECVNKHKELEKEWKTEVKEWKKHHRGQKYPYEGWWQEWNASVLAKLQELAAMSWDKIEP